MPNRAQSLDKAIGAMLAEGLRAFDHLCAAGILNRHEWPDDDKWTAIGLMWGLEKHQISIIRRRLAGAPPEEPGQKNNTAAAIKRVHRKGKRILDAMTEEDRRDWRRGEYPPKSTR